MCGSLRDNEGTCIQGAREARRDYDKYMLLFLDLGKGKYCTQRTNEDTGRSI